VARRVNGRAGIRVPGLADAIACRWRRLAEHFPGPELPPMIDAIEAGQPVAVARTTIFSALFALGDPLASAFRWVGSSPEDRTAMYVVTGDHLRLQADL
jgi:hypothetical protein